MKVWLSLIAIVVLLLAAWMDYRARHRVARVVATAETGDVTPEAVRHLMSREADQ